MTVMINVVGLVKTRNFVDKLALRLPDVVKETSLKVSKTMARSMRANISRNQRYSKRTPGLAKSIYIHSMGKRSVSIKSNAVDEHGVSYFNYVDSGTKAHMINDAFGVPGFNIMHPGAKRHKTKNFIKRAILTASKKYGAEFDRAFKKYLGGN